MPKRQPECQECSVGDMGRCVDQPCHRVLPRNGPLKRPAYCPRPVRWRQMMKAHAMICDLPPQSCWSSVRQIAKARKMVPVYIAANAAVLRVFAALEG
jgi:hypothetical protein